VSATAEIARIRTAAPLLARDLSIPAAAPP
jgi:hypothetical protein